jgi:uncharacterized membrane protein
MAIQNTIAERAASAAAYLPLLGRIILMFLPTRRSLGVRFHVYQATLYGFVSTVLLAGILCCHSFHCFACVLKTFAVVDLMLLITLGLAAFLARPITLPVLGCIARKMAEVGSIRQAVTFFTPSRFTPSQSQAR